MDALKAEQIASTKWRVLSIPFGGPFGGKDLDGEYFDRETDIKPHWFSQRPVIFQHGKDATVKDADMGTEDDLTMSDDGWWGTLWLNRSDRYWAQVDAMLRAGKMFGSSGSIGHLVRTNRKSGHIEVWPHAEQTLTPTPINFFARITASKAVPDLAAIAADLRPDLFTGGEPSGDLSGSGDAAAMQRRALALGRLLNLERRASSI